MMQASTRLTDEQYELFRWTTEQTGTTVSDALRMFVYSFNEAGGFPFIPRTNKVKPEPFETEEEAARFATDMAMELLHETR